MFTTNFLKLLLLDDSVQLINDFSYCWSLIRISDSTAGDEGYKMRPS